LTTVKSKGAMTHKPEPRSLRAEMSKPLVQPRGLPTTFDGMVRDGRMPPPKRINARTVWDIRQLDEAFMALPSDGYDDSDPFGAVKL
jgi:hypothetical protein